MNRLVIEVSEIGELSIYSELYVELTLINWKEVREEAESSAYHRNEIIEAANKELLHKTTGLKQVYP
jgi:hypothetical protein